MNNYDVKNWKNHHKSLFTVGKDNEAYFTITADNGRIEIQFDLHCLQPNLAIQKLYQAMEMYSSGSILRSGKCRVLGLEDYEEKLQIEMPSLSAMIFREGQGYVDGFYIIEKRKREVIELLTLIHKYVPFNRENCYDLAEILNKKAAWNKRNEGCEPVPCSDFEIKPEEIIDALELASVKSLIAQLNKITEANNTMSKQIELLTEQNRILNSRIERMETELKTLKQDNNSSTTSDRVVNTIATSFFA